MTENIIIDKKLFRSITNDATKSANAAGLVYVRSEGPGYTRISRQGKFQYMDHGTKITGIDELNRIKRLVIPPA